MDAERGVVEGFIAGAIEPTVEVASDASLVRDIIAGSQDALARAYDRHGGDVFGAAMAVSRDSWIAAEVVQETFLALWNRAELFDGSRGSLAAWLTTIARHRTIDRLRAAGRHDRAATFSSFAADADDHTVAEWLTASGQLIGAAGAEPGPEVALSIKETRSSIVDALAALDPMERRVIALAYDGGLSQSEIAASLGWPIGTVKTRTRRALRHLRDWLDESGSSPSESRAHPRPGARDEGPARRPNLPGLGLGDCLAPC